MLTDRITRIRGRIAEVGCRQADIAQAIGINETLLNTYLRGRRPMPEGFEARVHATLDALEEEQRVAAEAVEKLRAERAERVAQDADGERL